MLITPLRLPPPGEARIKFAGRVTPLGLAPRHLRQWIVFGLPCWINPRPCSKYELVPRTSVTPGTLLQFSDRAAPFLGNGFSAAEPWGDGRMAQPQTSHLFSATGLILLDTK
jgi:hypothetical protein